MVSGRTLSPVWSLERVQLGTVHEAPPGMTNWNECVARRMKATGTAAPRRPKPCQNCQSSSTVDRSTPGGRPPTLVESCATNSSENGLPCKPGEESMLGEYMPNLSSNAKCCGEW